VAIDNPSLVASVSCRTTRFCLRNNVHTAETIPHVEILQSNGCQCLSHLYKLGTLSKLPEFVGIVVGSSTNQYSMKAPSLFRSVI